MSASHLLKGIYLFNELNEVELQKIADIAIEKEVNSGEEVFMTGEKAKSFYVILLGSIKISANTDKGDSISIAQLATGAHFGEVAFLDEGNRSATAQATEFTRLVEVDFAKLKQLIASDNTIGLKVYRACSRYLATRLRATLSDLNAAKEARLKHF